VTDVPARARRAAARAVAGWDAFFHRPEPVTTLALFRILLGLLLLANWALLAPEVLTWLGERGVLSGAAARRLTGEGRLDVFAALPPTDAAVLAVFGATVLASVGLTVGYMTRWSAVVAFVGMVSIHHRNTLVLNSGDTLLRVLTFLLIFSPAGAAWSVDRWLARRGGDPAPGPVLAAPWTRRLIQFQVALLYVSTAWWKLQGASWRDGTASYYVLRLVEFQRFPLPLEPLWVEWLPATRLFTWASLAVELALGLLAWVPAVRYPVLAAGACLHLGLEYALNIPLFQWLMLASLVAFVPPQHLARAGAWLAARAGAPARAPAARGR
jgi:hypothetical protein